MVDKLRVPVAVAGEIVKLFMVPKGDKEHPPG